VAGAICPLSACCPPPAALVNIVPIWKGIDSTSIVGTRKNQAMPAAKRVS
jgi:hypothetical protein